jgi:hypothetical protein
MLEPGCVVCGELPAPLVCSRGCRRVLKDLGGSARAVALAEDAASRSATFADALAWRQLAARLRAIA